MRRLLGNGRSPRYRSVGVGRGGGVRLASPDCGLTSGSGRVEGAAGLGRVGEGLVGDDRVGGASRVGEGRVGGASRLGPAGRLGDRVADRRGGLESVSYV